MVLFFYLLSCLCSTSQADELALIGKKATQSGNWEGSPASLAIDGNATTFSVAAAPGDNSIVGWWEVDLGKHFQIDEVIITASSNKNNADYLQQFSIFLLNGNKDLQRLCSSFDSGMFKQSEMKTFTCKGRPFPTRYIKIMRNERAIYRIDAIALAEVNVKTGTLKNKLALIGKKATQSGYWLSSPASLAIDGNATTFSVAAALGDTSAVGWWEVDLGEDFLIDEVLITTSDHPHNAEFLQQFSIFLLNENKEQQLCSSFDSVMFQLLETKTFTCKGDPFPTRYIKIMRNERAIYRIDAIALAEVKVTTGTLENNLALIGKKATQSGNWAGNPASMAIDGNATTFSVAASKEQSGIGWWKVDLGEDFQIDDVIITASSDKNNAEYLQQFSIFLLNGQKEQLCSSFNLGKFNQSETKTFTCKGDPFPTRHIKIIRHTGASYRSDAIALAEVKVINGTLENNLVLIGKKTIQSRTWAGNAASMAIDGNPTTSSVAVSWEESGVGWWEVDLGEDYQIDEVIITSSGYKKNADYLQQFSIFLLNGQKEQQLCSSFDSGKFNQSETKTFTCKGDPFPTRYIKIMRYETAIYKRNAIALAEVNVKTGTLPSITPTSKSAKR